MREKYPCTIELQSGLFHFAVGDEILSARACDLVVGVTHECDFCRKQRRSRR